MPNLIFSESIKCVANVARMLGGVQDMIAVACSDVSRWRVSSPAQLVCTTQVQCITSAGSICTCRQDLPLPGAVIHPFTRHNCNGIAPHGPAGRQHTQSQSHVCGKLLREDGHHAPSMHSDSHAGMLQLLGSAVIHILSNYMCCMPQFHFLLYINSHATQYVKQDLPLHALKACD